MRAALGSSENSADQARLASSVQRAVTESGVEVRVTGPGRTPAISSGTAACRLPSAIAKRAKGRMLCDDMSFVGRIVNLRRVGNPPGGAMRALAAGGLAIRRRLNNLPHKRGVE